MACPSCGGDAAQPAAQSADPLVGARVGGYLVEARLGAGGMGRVYRALDQELGRKVALKFPHTIGTVARERFLREARAASAIDHPNVGTIYGVGEHEGRPFMAMALYEGRTLRDRIAEGPMPANEVESILRQLLTGLAAAHAAGLIHRDIKPSNVMIPREGPIKIVDFGLAKSPEADQPITREGAMVGTIQYCSPEQIRGRAVDARGDLWSVGVVAFEMLTGQLPFRADSGHAVIAHILTDPPPLERLPPTTPSWMRAVIEGLLQKEPERRAASAAEVLRMLDQRQVPRRRRRATMAASFVVLCALGAGLWWWSRGFLPRGERRLAFVASNLGAAGDDRLAAAISRLAARRLREGELRFAIVDHPAEANVIAQLGYRREPAGIALELAVGPAGGRAAGLGSVRATSVAEALRQLFPRLGERVGDGRQPRGPNEIERAEMKSLGARSFEAYRLYESIIDEINATIATDDEVLRQKGQQLLDLDPEWAHSYFAAVLAFGGIESEHAPELINRARLAIHDHNRDPEGEGLLAAIAALPNAEARKRQVAWLESDFEHSPDVQVGWILKAYYTAEQRNDELVEVLRQMHQRRLDLQFGADLAAKLRQIGRGDEVEGLLRDWLARAPDSEMALAAQVPNELDRDKLEAAIGHARDLVLLHGTEPRRIATLCDVLIAADRTAEARPLADQMLQGTPHDRRNGKLRLGTIAIMEGRFSAALDTLRSESMGDNTEEWQSTFVLRDLDAAFGQTEEVLRLDAEIERAQARLGMASRVIETRFNAALARGCPKVEDALVGLPDGTVREIARRNVLRAAGAKGCIPCAQVVHAGLASAEQDARALYQFGLCAESEGKLELAKAALDRIRQIRLYGIGIDSTPTPYFSMLGRFHIARILERLGRAAEAKAAYSDFLAHWGHADHPLPEIDEARQALARLPH